MYHTLLFYGDFDTNRPTFVPGQSQFKLMSGAPSQVKPAPNSANGICFGYMTRRAAKGGKEMVCVSANEIAATTPVVLVPARHSDGKGYGPVRFTFGDRSAGNLLSDMIGINPQLADGFSTVAREKKLALPKPVAPRSS